MKLQSPLKLSLDLSSSYTSKPWIFILVVISFKFLLKRNGFFFKNKKRIPFRKEEKSRKYKVMSNTKRDWSIAIIIVSVIVFVASLGIGAYRFVSIRDSAILQAKTDSNNLKKLIVSAYELLGDIDTTTFKRQMNMFYENNAKLSIFTLKDSSGKNLYILPVESPFLNKTEKAETAFIDETKLNFSSVIRQETFQLIGFDTVKLESAFVIITNDDIFIILRDTSIIIASYLILLLILLLFLPLNKKLESSETEEAHEKNEENVIQSTNTSDEKNDTIEISEYNPEPPKMEAIQETEMSLNKENTIEMSKNNEEIDFVSDEKEPNYFDNSSEKEEIVFTETKRNTEYINSTKIDAPLGLFSEKTGLGWEAYLKERLASELARSASIEQDLVFASIKMQSDSSSDDSFVLLAKTVLDFFNYKDLAFEQGDHKIAVIIPSTDLEQGLHLAEEFIKRVTFLLKEHDDAENYLAVYVGITSRSGRLINAERILDEADAALTKAQAEKDSRIVAFKSDPDKYRKFVANNCV